VTTEHVQKAVSGVTLPGDCSRGVKLVCPLLRRPDMTHEEFVAHWLGRHVPIARAHHPGMTKYVTNVVDQRLSDTGEPWDGFAELQFEARDSLAEGLFDSPEGERIVRDDIARFIGRTIAYRVAEFVEKPGR
jgi:uncharacterized protein (TIGR02118 family)